MNEQLQHLRPSSGPLAHGSAPIPSASDALFPTLPTPSPTLFQVSLLTSTTRDARREIRILGSGRTLR